MAIKTIDKKSGAIQFTPTEEEKEIIELRRQIKELKLTVKELVARIERLENKDQ